MAKIDVNRTITGLQKQFDRVKSQREITISDLPSGRLRDLARAVAPKVSVSTACGIERRPGPIVSSTKLKSAIVKFANDLKKADKNKDLKLDRSEAAKLSSLSKDLLDLEKDGSPVSVDTSC